MHVKDKKGDDRNYSIIITLSNLFTTPLATGLPFSWKDYTPIARLALDQFIMRWIGRHRWMTIVALALGIPLVTFVIFERWFLVPMPKGPLEAWLGF